MRVLSGRLKAVFVAPSRRSCSSASSRPAATFASDPPGLARFMNAIGRGRIRRQLHRPERPSGAYGKYQIMPSSWRGWASRYLGDAERASRRRPTRRSSRPAKFRALYSWLSSWRRVAYWWLTGSSRTSGWSTYATRYVTKVMALLRQRGPGATSPARPARQAGLMRSHASHRLHRGEPDVAYSAAWRSASLRALRGWGGRATRRRPGRRPRSRSTGRASPGTDRSDRPAARHGSPSTASWPRTVDLHSRSFAARSAVFSKAWAEAGKHTLVIEVVGTAGHPYVAIDEFVGRRASGGQRAAVTSISTR